MFHTTFTTEVRVTEDDSDPERLKTEFELIRSVSGILVATGMAYYLCLRPKFNNYVQDILNRFHGSWLVTPETDANGQVVGCTAVLEQDVLPRGEQSFFAKYV